jgi:hypothetical protein
MTISKAQSEVLIAELRPVIDAILARHGMDTKYAWKYGPWLELKLTATSIEEGPNGVNLGSPEAQYFTKFGYTTYKSIAAGLSGAVTLDAPLGTLFESRGEVYAFAGIAAKRSKYPIVGRKVADGTITFFTDAIIAKLNGAAASAAV